MMENFFLRTDQSARISAVDPHATKGLFVGDLSSFCTEKDLHYLFSEFGNITNVEIKRGRHGDSLLHGFVEFDSETSAHLAIQGLHGRKFKGRKMRVNWTNMKVPKIDLSETWVQLQVNFTTKNTAAQVTEEFLESIFTSFGTIADVIVKRHLLCMDPLQISGYGFVFFHDMTAAMHAMSSIRNVQISGICLDCTFSPPKKEEKKATPAPPRGAHVQSFPPSTAQHQYHHNVAPSRGQNMVYSAQVRAPAINAMRPQRNSGSNQYFVDPVHRQGASSFDDFPVHQRLYAADQRSFPMSENHMHNGSLYNGVNKYSQQQKLSMSSRGSGDAPYAREYFTSLEHQNQQRARPFSELSGQSFVRDDFQRSSIHRAPHHLSARDDPFAFTPTGAMSSFMSGNHVGDISSSASSLKSDSLSTSNDDSNAALFPWTQSAGSRTQPTSSTCSSLADELPPCQVSQKSRHHFPSATIFDNVFPQDRLGFDMTPSPEPWEMGI